MIEFRDYDITYPELVYDIVDYFRASNNVKKTADKSVMDFCLSSRFSKQNQSGDIIQPSVVYLICENLVHKGLLNRLKAGLQVVGIDANYLFLPQDEEFFKKKDSALVFHLNCLAYGFRYICSSFKKHVIPVNHQFPVLPCCR